MSTMQSVLRSVTAIMLAGVPLVAAAQDHCSRETLNVRGTPVSIALCVAAEPGAANGGLTMPIDETFSGPGGSVTERRVAHFITGAGPGRVLQNVELSRIGLQGTLHLTLVYLRGNVSVESAMLTPGAVTIK